MIKQQKIMIAALLAVFVILLAAYFVVVRPLTTPEETTKEPLTTDAGEGAAYNTLTMFPQVKREDIQSLEVHNEYGTYKFVYSSKLNDFVIEGHENLAYNATMFSQLVVDTGMTLAFERMIDSPSDEELVEFGFTDEDPAYYELTTKGGTVHHVTVGDRIISGGGYYAMYEGRNAIYVLSAAYESTVLAPVETMVMPILTAGVTSTTYFYIDNFTIKHYGEDFFITRNRTQQELAEMETTALAEAVGVFPAEYPLSMYYDQALQTLASYEGESVAAIDLSEENLEKYGLVDEPYSISYEYDGYKYKLVASEPVDGYYYVSTSMFGIIVKVPVADFEFLRWDLMRWINSHVFSRGITYVDNIRIESESLTETFRLFHHPNDDPNLVIIGDDCGQITDVRNFREFYKTLLLVNLEGYAPDGTEPSEDTCMLKFTVTTNGGSVTEYAFYRYSTRRCLLTINGQGQFYVLAEVAEKVISDAGKVIAGVEINSTAKN